MNNVWVAIVRLIHVLFVAYMVYIPFTTDKYSLILHLIIVPFLFLHWYLNNDTCALTELEKLLSGKKKNKQTFIGSIVSPIFKISDKEIKKVSWYTLCFLWLVTILKLRKIT